MSDRYPDDVVRDRYPLSRNLHDNLRETMNDAMGDLDSLNLPENDNGDPNAVQSAFHAIRMLLKEFDSANRAVELLRFELIELKDYYKGHVQSVDGMLHDMQQVIDDFHALRVDLKDRRKALKRLIPEDDDSIDEGEDLGGSEGGDE